MLNLPVSLVAFLIFHPPPTGAFPPLQNDPLGLRTGLSSIADHIWPTRSIPLEKRSNLNTNPNGSTFLWLPQDEYSGKTFFE